MKVQGIEVTPPSIKKYKIIRDGGNIEFTIQPVLDYTEFEALCPPPKPRIRQHVDGRVTRLVKEKPYIKSVEEHSQHRWEWMLLKSLEPSNIEWSTIKMNDPSTWTNIEEEFTKAGITSHEFNRLIAQIVSVNGVTQDLVEEMQEGFSDETSVE